MLAGVVLRNFEPLVEVEMTKHRKYRYCPAPTALIALAGLVLSLSAPRANAEFKGEESVVRIFEITPVRLLTGQDASGNSVLKIEAPPGGAYATGSGFVVHSDDTHTYIVTNHHVVEGWIRFNNVPEGLPEDEASIWENQRQLYTELGGIQVYVQTGPGKTDTGGLSELSGAEMKQKLLQRINSEFGEGVEADAEFYRRNARALVDLFDLVPAKVHTWNEAADLAVLQVPRIDLPALPLIRDEVLEGMKGEPCMSAGFPGDAKQNSQDDAIAGFSAETRKGTIVNFHKQKGAPVDVIRHDASISFGNSGGPLLDEYGVVIGVNYGGGSNEAIIIEDTIVEQGRQNFYAIRVNELVSLLDKSKIPFQYAGSWSFPGDKYRLPLLAGAILLGGLLVVAMAAGAYLLFASSNDEESDGVARDADARVNVIERKRAFLLSSAEDKSHVLVGVAGEYAGRVYEIGSGIRVGRDRSICNLVIAPDNPRVSKVHLEIQYFEGKYLVRDLWSKYGSFLNNTNNRVPSDRFVPVEPGTLILLADSTCTFRVEAGS